MKLIYALCGLLLANAAWAVPDVVVDSVRMPAWLERGAQRKPLAVGMELGSGDALVTGQGSRVLLRSADGSNISLGANARVVLNKVGRQHDGRPQFQATLLLEKGPLRFTTSQRGKLRTREVAVRAAGVNVAISAGDVWCNVTDADSGMVLLLAGTASVAHGADAPLALDQPLNSVVMAKGEAPLPMSGIGQKRLTKLMQETEIASGQGALRIGGRWKVNLLEQEGEVATLASYDALRSAGYDARILPLTKSKYRLRIIGSPSRAEAEALAAELRGKMGITAPQVSR